MNPNDKTNSNEDFEKDFLDYQNFPGQLKSIMLATVDREGDPDVSCLPFTMDSDKNCYVFVSYLTLHANNLRETGKGSILFVEEEAKTINLFARKRLSYQCSSTIIDKKSEERNKILEKFKVRHGQIIDVMRNFDDFDVFKLTPHSGRFVTGFGKIYDIENNELDNLILYQKKK